VLNKSEIPAAMGYYGESTDWIYDFMHHLNTFFKLPHDFFDSLESKIHFRYSENDETPAEGILPNVFFEACTYIIKARNENLLFATELKFAEAAEQVLGNSLDIDKKISHATGFERYKLNHKESLQRYYKKQVDDNAGNWIKTFGDDFFHELFVFFDIDWIDLNQKQHFCAMIINDIVFSRLPENLLNELRSSKPKMKYRKDNLPEQFMEHPKLKAHTLGVITLMKASGGNQRIFNQLLDKTFPKIHFNEIEASTTEIDVNLHGPILQSLNESLLKAVGPKPNPFFKP
jgi:hypothetical protein